MLSTADLSSTTFALDEMLRIKQTGVTLLELMIVTVVVAILAAIAYPSYQDQVRRSRRAKAQAFMMEVSARQQQRFVDVRSYATGLGTGATELNMTAPPELNGFYDVRTTPAAAPLPPGFAVTATPAGAQASDSCGVLSINQAGEKLAGGVATPRCW